jgi:hypoxanthine phosphoribosyltransferase
MGSKFIEISDSDRGFPVELLSVPLHYRSDLESVLIPQGLISDRTERMAVQIIQDLAKDNKQLIAFCVLKGGYKFFANLVDKIQNRNRNNDKQSLPMIINFIRIDVRTWLLFIFFVNIDLR